MTETTTAPGQLTSWSQRDVPWAKLDAAIVGGAKTASEAAHRGGLNFKIKLEEVARRPDNKSSWKTIETRYAVARDDTDEFFEVVSEDYTPVQYSEAFAFMDEINPEYVAAGTLYGGRQGFMVVRLPDRAANNLRFSRKIVDEHDMYVVLRAAHDRSRGIEVAVMNLRRKCMNALTLSSFTKDAPQKWSVRHVGADPMARLNEARMTLAHADAYMAEFDEIAHRLHDIDLDVAEAEKLMETLLPDRPRRPKVIHSIITAWQNPETNGFFPTGWGLTNAVDEYFEWGRSDGLRTNSSRFTGGLDGASHRWTDRTAQLLLRRH